MKNLKFNSPLVIGISVVVVVVSALAIKSNADHQAQVKREMELYEIKKAELRRQLQLQSQAQEDEAKARAFSQNIEDENWLRAYCANPNGAYFSSFTKLYHSTAEEEAKKNGQPIPTVEQAIADRCGAVSSSSPSPSPSVAVSIEPITSSPSP
jgi:hypothetical protein